MARNTRSSSEEPAERTWTPDSIRMALRKFRRRLADVEAFDPQSVTEQFDPRITALETSLRETLADVFGRNSRSYRNYQAAASLDTAGINLNGTPLHRVIQGLVHGKGRSITLIKSAIQSLEEKMSDEFPGEPLDKVALSAGTAIMATASAIPGDAEISGAGAMAVAGDVLVSIQDGKPISGANSFDTPSAARYEELLSRVALLETSLGEVRRVLAAPASDKKVGIGHNQGPDFSPVPIEELDDIDRLIALLKEQGPIPPVDPTELIELTTKTSKLSERIDKGLIVLGTELAKGAARETGKELLIPLWTAVSSWITSVGHALLTWLGLS